MLPDILHALDLALMGDWDRAKEVLEPLDDPIAGRLFLLVSELESREHAQTRAQAVLRHEIGNALSIAKANLEGVIDGVLEQTPERMHGISDAMQTVAELLDEWRRRPTHALDPQGPERDERFNMCALIGAQAAAIEGLAKAKQVRVSYRACGAHHPECMYYRGDPSRVGQVLRNILINAVRYTPPGGSVELTCDKPDAEITVVVTDSGPGIAAEDLPRIFESGFRAHEARRTDANGSGLGLAVVSDLLGALGGNARVLSHEGRGATFSVRLPAVTSAGA
ncbi:MAG: sensor histidine kinase [Candidatus Eremiobacteraeota bacterium]|nr:sensor histidine kinase [Candidatus Eremiobacteraeota bacterium]